MTKDVSAKGRNLNMEVDKVREMMNGIAEDQPKIKATVYDIRESINLLNMSRGPSEIGIQVSTPTTSPMVIAPILTPMLEGHQKTQQNKEEVEWMEKIEEQIKDIKGSSSHSLLKIEELTPIVDVVIRKDFKVPNFNKYDGSGNPRSHLISYGTNMVVWSRDDKFLIGFFHESVKGPAL